MAIQIRIRYLLALVFFAGSPCFTAFAQEPLHRATAQSQIVQPLDESQVVTLNGNVHPQARAEYDLGVLAPETRMDRLILVLTPPAERQAELDTLVEVQHDPASPLFHQWLTPAQFGARFGAGPQDVARVVAWLQAHGFAVGEIPASNRLLIFSGTAAQVADTFHTEIHRYSVNGVEHLANTQDPQIPAALSDIVVGVVSLHDFRRTSLIAARKPVGAPSTGARPEYSSGSTHYLFPADWATIYDLDPLYGAGTTGSGTSIAIVGRSNINLSDVATFRSIAGLAANNPTVILAGANPGLVSGDQDESTLDVEWSGAIAPAATVKFVVGASTATTDGVDLSAQYIVNHATAKVVSTSYGSCEQYMGTTELAFYNSLWQQAASQGMSAFVSSGDSGAAGCSYGGDSSGSGTGVNGLCSSPYSTCVGGTEFNEGSNTSQYWSTTNSSSYESALSYIPEEVWNESGLNGGSGLRASSGGASVVYPQPKWQQGLSGTSGGMRAVPDVAMSASGHDGYIIAENGSYWVIAGTSAASPSFAGLMALVVQSKGGNGQGNANAGLYPLLNASQNPFHPTPSGNNSVPGVTGFTANGGEYNLATGLGSVDGAVLVSEWGSATATTTDFVMMASVTSATVLTGKTTTLKMSVTESGTGKNKVTLAAKAPTGVTITFSSATVLPGTPVTVTVSVAATAAAGAQAITLTGSDASGTQNVTYALTVTKPPTLTLSASPETVTVVQGANAAASVTAATAGSFTGNISLTVSGLPTGVTAGWSANPIATATGASTTQETLTLTASATATVGNATVKVTAAGDGLTASQSFTLQVQQAAGISLAFSPAAVSMQSMTTATVTVTATALGGVTVPSRAAGASVKLVSGLPKGFTSSWSTPNATSSGTVVWKLTLSGGASSAAGSSTLNVTAQIADAKTGKVYAASKNIALVVTLTPPTLTVVPDASCMTVVNPIEAITSSQSTASQVFTFIGGGTFKGPLNLSVSGLPAHLTAAWSSAPVQMNASNVGTSTLTITAGATSQGTAQATVAPGTYTVSVTASGGGLTVVKTIQVLVAGVLVTPAVTTLTIHRGTTGTLQVTTKPMGGASGVIQMGLAASAPLNGVAVSAAPASIPAPGSATTTFSFAVNSTAAITTYQLNPAAALFASSTASTPELLGWSSSLVTLKIVQ